MKNTSVVSISNLVKRFPMGNDFFIALKGIDLNIESTEFTGLVGSSGSGKTTLVDLLLGLLLKNLNQNWLNILALNMLVLYLVERLHFILQL